MRGLAEVVAKQGGPTTLEGFSATIVQHLFPPNIVRSLLTSGLDTDGLWVAGKSYSTHADAYADLLGLNVNVHSASFNRNGETASAATGASVTLQKAAADQLREMFASVQADELEDKTARPRFLLVDEGGKLIEALHSPEFRRYAHLCVAIEHTDRGIQVIEKMEAKGQPLLCPVVNMARSQIKKETEAHAIGESVVFHTEHALANAANDGVALQGNQALVVGFGAVGSRTAHALKRRGYDVTVLEVDADAAKAAAREGFTVAHDRVEALQTADLLISSTGVCTLPLEDYGLLKDGAVLVNAASGNHELGLGEAATGAASEALLRRLVKVEEVRPTGDLVVDFRGTDVLTGSYPATSAHRHLVVQAATDKEVLVLNGGAVVNMSMGLPPEYAQLTLSMVMASIFQAATLAARKVEERPAGLVDLELARQEAIEKAISDALVADGLPPLNAPDFRELSPWA